MWDVFWKVVERKGGEIRRGFWGFRGGDADL